MLGAFLTSTNEYNISFSLDGDLLAQKPQMKHFQVIQCHANVDVQHDAREVLERSNEKVQAGFGIISVALVAPANFALVVAASARNVDFPDNAVNVHQYRLGGR